MAVRTTRNHIAPLLAAVAVVAAIASAPVAAADEPVATDQPSAPSQSCAQLGAAEYRCESPGNAQLDDAPPVTNYFPYAG